MLGLALFGVVVNGYAAWRLRKGRTMNERVLKWHLLEDVLGWLAVLVVAVLKTCHCGPGSASTTLKQSVISLPSI